MDFITSLYEDKGAYSATVESTPHNTAPLHNIEIIASLDHHRKIGEATSPEDIERDTDTIFSYPSVLEGLSPNSDAPLHFAPATILNLAETRASIDVRSRGAVGEERRSRGEGSIVTLYVPVETQREGFEEGESIEPILNCVLRPLSKAAVEELIRSYLYRDPSVFGSNVSAVELLPDPASKSEPNFKYNYCAVFNPQMAPHAVAEYYSFDADGAISSRHDPLDWSCATACLLQYEVIEGNPEDLKTTSITKRDSSGKKHKKKWDSAILSHFCRWR